MQLTTLPTRTKPPALQWTGRDAEIVRAIYKHRFLQATDLLALLGGGLFGLKRRCRLLERAGYLQRSIAQPFDPQENAGAIYGIGLRGAQYLTREDPHYSGVVISGKDLVDTPSRQRGWNFIDHELGIARIMSRLHVACEGSRFVLDWRGQPNNHRCRIKRYDPEATGKLFPDPKKQHRQPDAYFSIRFPEKGVKDHYFLEYDRHNISPERMRRRFMDYFLWWKQRRKDERDGRPHDWAKFADFRLLVVTTYPAHMERLQHEAASFGRDKNGTPWRSIRFTHTGLIDWQRPESLLGPIYYYPKDETEKQHDPAPIIAAGIYGGTPTLHPPTLDV